MPARPPTSSIARADRSAAEKRAAAVALMRRVGIADPEQRILQYPHQFSGGMRQRAGIAMALLTDPALLIADEPTTALDVTMEAQIILLLRQLKAELDATVVVVSHNLGLIAELCDEVVVLYAGEVLERGGIHRIFGAPAHPYTRALMECDPARVLAKTRRLPVIAGEVPNLRQEPAGCVFASRCPGGPAGLPRASGRPTSRWRPTTPRVATCSIACRPPSRHRASHRRGRRARRASRSSRSRMSVSVFARWGRCARGWPASPGPMSRRWPGFRSRSMPARPSASSARAARARPPSAAR